MILVSFGRVKKTDTIIFIYSRLMENKEDRLQKEKAHPGGTLCAIPIARVPAPAADFHFLPCGWPDGKGKKNLGMTDRHNSEVWNDGDGVPPPIYMTSYTITPCNNCKKGMTKTKGAYLNPIIYPHNGS